MKIVGLHAENVKRLRAVDITPDPDVQVVGGRNAQGKTSVLDAIWLALGGGKASKTITRPVRDGQDHATVVLDLGDLKVTRTWNTQGRSTLRVEAADGARYTSPQAILDRLVGAMSLDPLAFTRLPARQQREALLDLVDLDVDLDALETERAALYTERTEVGREGKALGDIVVDDTLPAEETSMQRLIADLHDAQEHNDRIEQVRREYSATCDRFEAAAKRVEDLRHRLEALEADLAAARQQKERADAALAASNAPIDTGAIEARMRTVETENAKIRANNAARDRAAEAEALRSQYQDLTSRITAIDNRKARALASARFPVDGLGFDDAGVTYRGVPFSQASGAEQIRVSVAMAMALNPRLRVLRIMDGSLLDAEAMDAIRTQGADAHFQLWSERVGNADDGAVVIEDGQVAQ